MLKRLHYIFIVLLLLGVLVLVADVIWGTRLSDFFHGFWIGLSTTSVLGLGIVITTHYINNKKN